MIITLDIKNAFNSSSWSAVFTELKNREIPLYLGKILVDYFMDGLIVYESQEESVQRKMYKGAPQGSVLDPLICNRYADDVALLVSATKLEGDENQVQAEMIDIADWL